MRKILILILCLVFTSPVIATDSNDIAVMITTTNQLRQHVNSLHQLLDFVHGIMVYEENGTLDLTAAQRTALLNQYSVIKALIVSTYAELP